MKVNFHPRSAKDKTYYINLIVYLNNKRLKFYTGIYLDPQWWDKSRGRVKNTVKFPMSHNYNRHLDYLEIEVQNKYYDLLRNKQKPTIEALKAHLQQITFKEANTSDTIHLVDYWEQLIDKRRNDPAYSWGTVKTYLTSLNHFKAFCKEHGAHNFKDISIKFIENFKLYLYKQDLSTNYVEKMVQQLRVMLNQAFEESITDNIEFRKKAFRVKKTATDEIYLNLNEINAIAKLNLSIKGLKLAQECFIIQCFTGVAYTDLTEVRKDNLLTIDNIPILSYYRGKTKKLAALPIHPKVQAIMELRDWQAFTPLKNQPYNRYLKEIGQAAGLTGSVQKMHTRGGIEQTETFPKYKLIGTHTARRSFTTNYILSGGTKEEAKLMIGHLRQDVTETYIKAEMQKRAVLLANRPFFTDS